MKVKFDIIIDKYIDKRDTALVGRDNGEKCVKIIEENIGNLIEIGNNYEKVNIIIPKRIITMNKSFFLGMFENIVKSYGKKAFEDKYIFTASDYICSKISKYVDYALMTTSVRDIIDA
jgi:hypothetical protein